MLKFDSNRPLDFVCVGRTNVDLYALEAETSLAETSGFKKSVGGSPANIAVGLSRLGTKTAMISKVKDDQFGHYIIDFLKKNNIDVSGVILDKNDTRTSLAFAEVKKESSEVIFYRKDASDIFLQPEEVNLELIGNAKALIISGMSLSASPCREAVLKIIDEAQQCETPIILDLDFRASAWESPQEASSNYKSVVEKCDIIVGNKEEFEVLGSVDGWYNLSGKEMSQQLFQLGVGTVIIKDGANGSWLYTSSGEEYNQGIFQVKALKPYGAGDGFLAGFCYGLISDLPLIEALNIGSAVAALVVSRWGCAEAMPYKNEIEKFIKKYLYA